MNIHPVSSKKTMLNPQDIFLVAAHEDKIKPKGFDEAVQKSGMSAERLKYTLFIKAYSDPRLLRMRAGNTLFTIAAFPNRVGFVRAYNADTAENFVENLAEFFNAARNMGFDKLCSQPNETATKAIKLAMKKYKKPESDAKFDSKVNLFVVTTGEARQ